MKIYEIIECNENFEDTIVWKHPSEDFNTKSQLIVGASQEAVFYLNGEGCAFAEGKHTLHTSNIPFIRKLFEFVHGNTSAFHCQVYFVNKVTSLNLQWGTPSQFDFIDEKFQVPMHAGASGSIGVKVEDSLIFMKKLIGANTSLTMQGLTGYFRDLIATRVKTYLSKVLSQVSIYTVTSYLEDISFAMQEKLREDMLPYGIYVDSFYVSTIAIPEKDKETINEVQNTLLRQGKLGYNWTDMQIAEIMKKYAENPGNQNNVGGMMAQMPISYAFGQMFAQNAGQPFMGSLFQNPPLAFGPRKDDAKDFPDISNVPPLNSLGDKKNDDKKADDTFESKKERLAQMKEDLAAFKEMLDMGIITQEDYDKKKAEWLAKL